ncbi:MAG: SRPBCC domain-containing protein [Rhodothermales bacterium]
MQDGKASTTRTFFSRTTAVSIVIRAPRSVVWALLTDAPEYPAWNSTVLSIENRIEPGSAIRLTSTLDPKRTFVLWIKTFEPEHRMVWGDANGRRTFTLTDEPAGVRFTMDERIGGPLFPLFARFIPPFDALFEQFAMDLKQAAERAV